MFFWTLFYTASKLYAPTSVQELWLKNENKKIVLYFWKRANMIFLPFFLSFFFFFFKGLFFILKPTPDKFCWILFYKNYVSYDTHLGVESDNHWPNYLGGDVYRKETIRSGPRRALLNETHIIKIFSNLGDFSPINEDKWRNCSLK